MNETIAEGLAALVVDIIVQRSVEAFKQSAEATGIPAEFIPRQYLEAVETGAAVGAAQTMLVMKEMGLIATLDTAV